LASSQLRVRERITRVLDPHVIAGLKQHADREVDGLLRAGGDDDLRGIAAYAACRPQIIADARAQLDQPGRIGVAEVVGTQGADGAMGQLAPGLDGTRIDERAAGVERASIALHRRSLELGEGLRRCRHGAPYGARRMARS
jgi:hypothetical protein